jgi:hypothetical protein
MVAETYQEHIPHISVLQAWQVDTHHNLPTILAVLLDETTLEFEMELQFGSCEEIVSIGKSLAEFAAWVDTMAIHTEPPDHPFRMVTVPGDDSVALSSDCIASLSTIYKDKVAQVCHEFQPTQEDALYLVVDRILSHRMNPSSSSDGEEEEEDIGPTVDDVAKEASTTVPTSQQKKKQQQQEEIEMKNQIQNLCHRFGLSKRQVEVACRHCAGWSQQDGKGDDDDNQFHFATF